MWKRCGAVSKLGWLALVASLLGSVGAPEGARAAPVVDLLFVARNGQAIDPVATVLAAAGNTLTMQVSLTTDVSLALVSFSLSFDGEISVMTAARESIPGFGPFTSFSVDDGTISSFSGIAGPGVLGPGTYPMGTVTWVVGSPVDDGADVRSGPLTLIDLVLGANQQPVATDFRSASVMPMPVPEPGTGSLLGLGLGLALAGCGRRRARAARRRGLATR